MNNTSMIIRLSGKLGKKIQVYPEEKKPMHNNPYLDWSAHLFRAVRTQYILLTNTATLYSVVLFGRCITDENTFLKRGMRQLDEMLQDNGFQRIFKGVIAPEAGTFCFSKALNRSVIGSMIDLVKQAQTVLMEEKLSPHGTALKLNEIPFSYLDYRNPKEAFQKIEGEAGQTE